MEKAAAEENLKFVIPGITKAGSSIRTAAPGITIRNGSAAREGLVDKFDSNTRHLDAPAAAGQAPPKGSSFGSSGCDDHPLAAARHISFVRIAPEPILMREAGSGTRLRATSLFARHGLVPGICRELSEDEAIREAILAGLGISIITRFTLGLEPEPSRLARIRNRCQ